MADLKTTLCGIQMDTPFVLGSGPAGWDAEALARCSRAGAGAVVTKTIAVTPFVNATRHMVNFGQHGLFNNEGGSDRSMEEWKDDLKRAKDLGVKNLIASVYSYGSFEDVLTVAEFCENNGADMLEIVSDYEQAGQLADNLRQVRSLVKIPIITKVNANWKNTQEITDACDQGGTDAITAIDSIGPIYRFDIRTGKTLLGGKGYGYMSGEPIFPIALRYVHEIASTTDKDIIGLGGVSNAEAALEMLIAGASAVGVCSAAVLHGPDVFRKLNENLEKLMDKLGYKNISEVSRLSFKAGPTEDITVDDFKFDADKCKHCDRCVDACAYRARTFENGVPKIDRDTCRLCSLCFNMCPTKAIYF